MLRMFTLSSFTKALKLTRCIIQRSRPLVQDVTRALRLRHFVAGGRHEVSSKLAQGNADYQKESKYVALDEKLKDQLEEFEQIEEKATHGVRRPKDSPLSRLYRKRSLPPAITTEAGRAKAYLRKANKEIYSFIDGHNKQIRQKLDGHDKLPIHSSSKCIDAPVQRRHKPKEQPASYSLRPKRKQSVDASRLRFMRNMHREMASDVNRRQAMGKPSPCEAIHGHYEKDL